MNASKDNVQRGSFGIGPQPAGSTPAGGPKRRGWFVLSMGLNLLLVGTAAFYLLGKPPAAPGGSKLPPQTLATMPSEERAAPGPVTTLHQVTNYFHWRMVESEDYPTYLANLRAIGCPEETIRDILLADIEKLYGTKVATVPMQASFWSCGAQRETAHRARAERQRALELEKAALVRHLLDMPYIPDWEKYFEDLKGQALIRFVVGPVAEGVAEQTMAIMERSEDAVREIRSQANGILLPADEQQIQKTQEQTIAQLKGLLSREQFEEFGARVAALHLLSGDSGDFRLSAGEFREIARIYAAVFGLLSRGPFHLFGGREETPAQIAEVESRVKALLGEARFAEYQREKDDEFKNVCAVAEEHQISREVAVKIYEIRQLVKAEQQRLEAEAAGVEREAQWQEVQATTLLEVRRLLGDKAFEVYLNRGGQWLTNFPKL